ncbi:hypothetical protein HaLaN_19343 [Haematococcus lacustris]|uniref:Uncharacterized protein n=1 Tax=Haematococcus lacustris TaxID=44745 RepID=A0A699ZH88_HAELA|nr:hypothetical protein HaLaN_19343 [Haematococcus lacustris]
MDAGAELLNSWLAAMQLTGVNGEGQMAGGPVGTQDSCSAIMYDTKAHEVQSTVSQATDLLARAQHAREKAAVADDIKKRRLFAWAPLQQLSMSSGDAQLAICWQAADMQAHTGQLLLLQGHMLVLAADQQMEARAASLLAASQKLWDLVLASEAYEPRLIAQQEAAAQQLVRAQYQLLHAEYSQPHRQLGPLRLRVEQLQQSLVSASHASLCAAQLRDARHDLANAHQYELLEAALAACLGQMEASQACHTLIEDLQVIGEELAQCAFDPPQDTAPKQQGATSVQQGADILKGGLPTAAQMHDLYARMAGLESQLAAIHQEAAGCPSSDVHF